MSKHVTVPQLTQVVGDITTKADSRFRKAADSYTKTQVDDLIAAAKAAGMTFAGTIAGSALTADLLDDSHGNFVYNISSELVITAENAGLFKDRGVGDKVRAGDNVGVVFAGTFSAATGTAVAGVVYYERSGESEPYTYTVADVETGDSVSGLYIRDYLFDVLAAFLNYTAGDAIDITSGAVSVNLGSSANGLSVSNGLELAVVTGSHTAYVQASGTYVSGTKYYTDSTGATEVDTTSFEEGVTDVSSYYIAQTVNGTNGAMSYSDKNKLDSIEEASSSDIQGIINGIWPA